MVFNRKNNGKKGLFSHGTKNVGKTKDPFMTNDGIKTFDLMGNGKKKGKRGF